VHFIHQILTKYKKIDFEIFTQNLKYYKFIIICMASKIFSNIIKIITVEIIMFIDFLISNLLIYFSK